MSWSCSTPSSSPRHPSQRRPEPVAEILGGCATRIVFCGTPEFAVPSLAALARNGYPPVAVLTGPDRARGRGQGESAPAVKAAAVEMGIPVHQPPSPRDVSFLPLVRELAPDLLVVVAFRIIPAPVLTVPPLGSINLHASLLPRYRGAAPINWAIINGETETGVTTFFLEETVDTGAIILQRRTSIGEDEDAGSLHDRLAQLGAQAVLESVRMIESGKVPQAEQDHHAASPAPKIFREHCRIRWDRPSEQIRNFVRGLAPFPGAFTMHDARMVKIHRTERRPDAPPLTPGHVRVDTRNLEVGTADSPLGILELQLETRRRMGVEEFLRGYRIITGERFD